MKGPKFGEMSDNELEVEVRDMVSQIWKFRFQAATGQTEGVRKLRSLRRNIARAKTALRERELLALIPSRPAGDEGSEAHGK
jgi:large subunit ribosomal protein L29